MKNKNMIENGSYGKLFLNLCVPTIVIMLVMVIYNMADIFFIGRAGNANMVAALSMSMPLFTILSGLGNILGAGGCTAMSLALGSNDSAKLRAYSAFCFYGSIGIGLIFGIVSLLGLGPICRLFGANEDTFGYMQDYLRIIAIGAPILLFNNVFMNLIRADGSASASMVVNLMGTFTNIILDPILISVFHLGVSGAALATVIGNAVSVIYLLFYTGKHKDLFSFRLKDLSLKGAVAGRVISLGLPLSISTLLTSASSIVSNKMMISYGATAVAANGVAGKMGMLITMLIMGICMGLQPAISYNHAAGNNKRVGEILLKSTGLTAVLGTVLMIGSLIFRESLLAAFINDPAVIRQGRIMMLASVLVGPIYGMYQLCQTYLQSTGRAKYATVVSMLDKGLIFIPMLLLLNAVFGLNGLIFAGFVTNVLSIVVSGVLSLRVSGVLASHPHLVEKEYV